MCIENQIIFKIKSTLLNVYICIDHAIQKAGSGGDFALTNSCTVLVYFSLLFFLLVLVRILVSVSIADLWLQ